MKRFLSAIEEIPNENLRNIVLRMYSANAPTFQSWEYDYLQKVLDLSYSIVNSIDGWNQDDLSIFYAAIYVLANPNYKDEFILYGDLLVEEINDYALREVFLRSVICYDNILSSIGLNVTTFPANSVEYQVYNVHRLATSYFHKL